MAPPMTTMRVPTTNVPRIVPIHDMPRPRSSQVRMRVNATVPEMTAIKDRAPDKNISSAGTNNPMPPAVPPMRPSAALR